MPPVCGVGAQTVQVQSVNLYTGSALGFATIADGLAVVEEGGYVRLIYADRVTNAVATLTLASSYTPPTHQPGDPKIGSGSGADMALQANAPTKRVYVFSDFDGTLRFATLSSTGQPSATYAATTDQGPLASVTAMEIIDRGNEDISILAQRNQPGLQVFSLSATGAMTHLTSLADTAKSYLGDVSDMTHLQVDGRDFLLTASALENGITLLEIDAEGALSFVDAMGASDGLPLAGPVALQSVVLQGQQFVVVAGTTSNSLSVLRVNDMGVMFLQDHLIDDRDTRFDGVGALDIFAWAGRAFVVAAGTDNGLSVIEVLPDGRLSHMVAQPMETGNWLANVTGIETTVIGTQAVILLTDARGDRVHHLSVSLAGIGGLVMGNGGTVTGSALDDRMFGGASADTLQAGAGDDFLHDGGGNDLLTGGGGADVFVVDRDGNADRISDFQAGVDQLDVSDWGRIYSAAALQITSTATGAVVSYGTESLTITRWGGGSLTLSDADFLF